jgi:hypothetical protein
MNKLEAEAKKYTNRKNKAKASKPLTARRYLAGQALTGLLANRHSNSHSPEELKREAYNWADLMLED